MDKLMKLLADNKERGKRIKAEVKEPEATVYLYDTIGADWWGGISAAEMVKEINGLKVNTIHVRISSPGGDVFEARAIHTALQQHKAKIIVHIDGLAASAASYLALAGDEIEIAEGAFFMIHYVWATQIGDKNDMLTMAEVLEKIDGTLIADYQRKTGKDEAEIKAWMDAETWFAADEALEAGFVDRIYEGKKVDNVFDLSAFKNAPEKLKQTETSLALSFPGEVLQELREEIKDIALSENSGVEAYRSLVLREGGKVENLTMNMEDALVTKEKEVQNEIYEAAQARIRELELIQLYA